MLACLASIKGGSNINSMKAEKIKNKTENEFSPWLRAKSYYKAAHRGIYKTLAIYLQFTENFYLGIKLKSSLIIASLFSNKFELVKKNT